MYNTYLSVNNCAELNFFDQIKEKTYYMDILLGKSINVLRVFVEESVR